MRVISNCWYCRAEQGCSEEGEHNNNEDKVELKHSGAGDAMGSHEEGRREVALTHGTT